MFRRKSLGVLMLAALCGLFSVAASAESFSNVDVTPIAAPEGFEHSVTYKVTYLQRVGQQDVQVFPSRADKEKDMDLIMAQVIRRLIETEYEAKGRLLDETSVVGCDAAYLLWLVGTDRVTKAWSAAGVATLHAFLEQQGDNVVLSRLLAYLDYQDEHGKYISGLDVDPVLFRFGLDKQSDEVTVIMVTTSQE